MGPIRPTVYVKTRRHPQNRKYTKYCNAEEPQIALWVYRRVTLRAMPVISWLDYVCHLTYGYSSFALIFHLHSLGATSETIMSQMQLIDDSIHVGVDNKAVFTLHLISSHLIWTQLSSTVHHNALALAARKLETQAVISTCRPTPAAHWIPRDLDLWYFDLRFNACRATAVPSLVLIAQVVFLFRARTHTQTRTQNHRCDRSP